MQLQQKNGTTNGNSSTNQLQVHKLKCENCNNNNDTWGCGVWGTAADCNSHYAANRKPSVVPTKC